MKNSTPQKNTTVFEVSQHTSTTRKSSPTTFDNQGNVNLPRRSAYRRQVETLLASAEINGGSIENRKPAIDGMFSTILKYTHADDMSQYLKAPGKLATSYAKVVKDQNMRRQRITLFVPLVYFILGV